MADDEAVAPLLSEEKSTLMLVAEFIMMHRDITINEIINRLFVTSSSYHEY